MFINKLLFFVIAAVALLYSQGRKTKVNKWRCVAAITVILLCITGLRTWQMGDMWHYCWAYAAVNLPDWTPQFVENGDTIGLQIFLHIMGKLGLNFEICVFVTAAFVTIVLGVFVFRYSTSPFWSYVMYLTLGFYLLSLSAMKQTIAMAFVMLAMMAIIEKKPLRFIFFVALGTAFHTPAVAFLVAYPVANKKIDWLYFVIIGALLVVVFFFRDQVKDLFVNTYYDGEMEFEAVEFMGGRVYVMLALLMVALILRPIREFDVVYRQVFNINVLATVIQTFSVYDNVFTRLADYFFQFSVLLIPMMLQPYKLRIRLAPDHRDEIRYWSPKVMYIGQFALLLMSIWFYTNSIDGSSKILNEFCFVWQAKGQTSMEMLAGMLAEYGG